MRFPSPLLATAALAAAGLTACPAPQAGPALQVAAAPSPPPSPAPHSVAAVEAAACAAFAGAGIRLVPAADPAAAPVITPGRRYDVALGPGRTHLALAVPRAGEWSVFLARDHFFLLLDPTEAVVFSLEDAGAPAACSGLARHLAFELAEGVRYRLELAPAAAPGAAPLALFVGETHP